MSERRTRRSGAAELERRNRELSILNAIASALNSTVDLSEALHAALAQVAALLDLHTGWVWLLDEETCAPYLAASQDLPPGLANYPRRMEGSCYCLDTYTAGDLSGAANVNVVTCTRLKGLVDGANGLRYHASIPLYAQDKKLGVLNVASSDWRELAADDLRLPVVIDDNAVNAAQLLILAVVHVSADQLAHPDSPVFGHQRVALGRRHVCHAVGRLRGRLGSAGRGCCRCRGVGAIRGVVGVRGLRHRR